MRYTANTLNEIYRIFEKLNAKYFENKLPHPIFTIEPTGRKRVLGWCTVSKEWKAVDKELKEEQHEINICADHLQSDILLICETIQHELVHYYNVINDIQDCRKTGSYHNKKFKDKAEKVGLICDEKDRRLGYGITSPSPEFKKFVEEEVKPDKNMIMYFKPKVLKLVKIPKKILFKYSCPTCELTAKAKKGSKIVCQKCNKPLEMEPDTTENTENQYNISGDQSTKSTRRLGMEDVSYDVQQEREERHKEEPVLTPEQEVEAKAILEGFHKKFNTPLVPEDNRIFIETEQMRHDKRMTLNKLIRLTIQREDPLTYVMLKNMKKGERKAFYRKMRHAIETRTDDGLFTKHLDKAALEAGSVS